MTYDPEADGAFVLADGIANYLGIALENTADGIAFVWDGSADAENGFVDATDEEVLIATIKTTMTEDQRAAYEAAGAPAFALLNISGVEDSDKYFDGTDYLVSVYADDLAIDRVPASYTAHADEAVEITTVAGDIKESTEAICGNGEIELSDFIRVVRAFDESATDAYKTTVDLDENGAVNVTDLGIVKANFSKTAADVTVEVK